MIEVIQFEDEPIAELIRELSEQASKWCEGNCLYFNDCFGEATYNLERIEGCKKVPKLYKLFWRAKSKNISSDFSPVIIYKEKDDQAKKG